MALVDLYQHQRLFIAHLKVHNGHKMCEKHGRQPYSTSLAVNTLKILASAMKTGRKGRVAFQSNDCKAQVSLY